MREGVEFYADDIDKTCLLGGSDMLEMEWSGIGLDAEPTGITCMSCLTTFVYRPIDDDDIPF
jgi:hypothetical protein